MNNDKLILSCLQNTFGFREFKGAQKEIINNIINKITLNWKMNYKIILTGGYANLFKKVIKRKTSVDQNITIKGVSKVYKEFL